MSAPPPREALSAADVAQYGRDGFLCLRGLFSPEEAAVLRTAVEGDTVADSKAMAMSDGAGRVARLALWLHLDAATAYGAAASSRRLVRAVRTLFEGHEPYHIHSKLVLKAPGDGGFRVHSDFGYWYQVGCLDPNLMMSVVIAIDDHNLGNGCLHVLRGSHKLGRLEHGSAGSQAGADPAMVERARARLETVACEMRAGDVLFTNSNLIHWSQANTSTRWRRALIVAYNGVDNPPGPEAVGIIPLPSDAPPLAELDDGELLRLGPKGHSSDATRATVWLGQERNESAFKHGAIFDKAAAEFEERASLK